MVAENIYVVRYTRFASRATSAGSRTGGSRQQHDAVGVECRPDVQSSWQQAAGCASCTVSVLLQAFDLTLIFWLEV
jgi:hypothetical protein